MKIFLITITLYLFFGPSWAEGCQPYTLPASTIPCPQGFAGMQSTWTTKVCPSGNVTTSTTYDTSRCVPIITVGTGTTATSTVGGRATTNSSDCVAYSYPTPGSTIACPGQPNRLQWKTTSKVCPSGIVTKSANYDTSNCATPNTTPTCNVTGATTNQDGSCSSAGVAPGCPAGQHWQIVRPGDNAPGFAVGTNHCVNNNVCPIGSSGNYPNCVCPSPSVYSQANNACVASPTDPLPTCIPSSTPLANAPVACGSGFSGTKFTTTTTTNSCPGNVVSQTTSGYNTSACGCLNGATDYPTCQTLPRLPPVCPAPANYCDTKFSQSTYVILQWGTITYGSAPTCTPTKHLVGARRANVTEDCPAPYNQF